MNPRDIYIAAAKYSDSCWKFIPGDDNNQDTCIRSINASHPLKLVTEANIRDQGVMCFYYYHRSVTDLLVFRPHHRYDAVA